MAYDIGGGGGRAPSFAESSRISFDKPFDVAANAEGKFTAEMAEKIDEMFRQLYLSQTKTEDRVVAAEEEIDNLDTGGWTVVYKTADEERSSGNDDDDDLQFAMEASKTYVVRIRLYFINGALANAPRWTPTGPASPTLIRPVRAVISATSWTNIDGNDVAYPAESTATCVAGAPAWVFGEFLVQNGAAAGNFIIQWQSASSSAGNEVTLHQGSYLEYRKLG